MVQLSSYIEWEFSIDGATVQIETLDAPSDTFSFASLYLAEI